MTIILDSFAMPPSKNTQVVEMILNVSTLSTILIKSICTVTGMCWGGLHEQRDTSVARALGSGRSDQGVNLYPRQAGNELLEYFT